MHTRTLLLCLVAAIGGCSGNTAMNGDGGGGGGDDLAMAPDLAVSADDRVLTMDEFTVPAGGEVFKCQDFANPWGAEAEIREWESHMATGSHHLLVFYKDGAVDAPAADCSGLEFSSGPYGAQTPDATITYPTGVAALLKAGQGLRFASHYINATKSPITAKVKLVLRKAQPGTIKDYAGIFFFNNVQVYIPNDGMPHTITKTCTAPRDMTLLYSVGHMHKHATNLTATLDGMEIYKTDDWATSPFQAYTPPLQVKSGQKFTFSCTYVNNGAGPLIFGESAEMNEMCIFDGQFYPVVSQQDIVCM